VKPALPLAKKLIEAPKGVADACGTLARESRINQCVDPPLFGVGSLLADFPQPSFNLGSDRFRFGFLPSDCYSRLR